ncbi:LuxR C-terminal-related transcriptional regulator [Enterobacter cloacae]|uniref:LuxR C-terminal-related transcriptional regulator n=1 Tax=Enterobacter cloacae TaxID=550 RepID=UPI0029725227|nr:helix-turn-helix transcriptional regulator [Enterobacter cloacae]
MISVLINDTDLLFKNGMQFLFMDIFASHFNESVEFLEEYTPDNIALADVIVLSLCPGERYTCFPELQARTRGIIIGLVSEEATSEPSPSCFSDIIYITRNSSRNGMTNKIRTVWGKWLTSKKFEALPYCLWCKHRQMSEHQFRLMEYLHQGKTINRIAQELGINSKTIFAHKYLVMHKFNLRNDNELKHFLDMLAKKQRIPINLRMRVGG